MDGMPEYLKVALVADLLHVHPSTVKTWAKQGKLAVATLPSGHIRVATAAVLQMGVSEDEIMQQLTKE